MYLSKYSSDNKLQYINFKHLRAQWVLQHEENRNKVYMMEKRRCKKDRSKLAGASNQESEETNPKFPYLYKLLWKIGM